MLPIEGELGNKVLLFACVMYYDVEIFKAVAGGLYEA